MSYTCKFNHGGRHSPRWVSGVRWQREGNPLLSVCRYCGENIERAHRKSAQWFSVPHVVTKSARSIYIAIEGDSASDVAALFGDSIAEANRAVHEGRTIDDTREFGTAKGTLRVEPGDQP